MSERNAAIAFGVFAVAYIGSGIAGTWWRARKYWQRVAKQEKQ